MAQHDTTPGFSEDERRVWITAILIQMRLRHAMAQQMYADNGISLSDYGIFVALNDSPQAVMRMSDLALRIGWELSRLSHQLRRMEARGLVIRFRNTTDRRVTEVRLTEEGKARIAEAIAGHTALARRLYLDAVPEGLLEPLRDALESIYANLTRHDNGGEWHV